MKQGLEQCLAEYTTDELMQFHANLNALFLCCNEDFKLFPLLLRVHFVLAQRKESIVKKYLKGIEKILNIPAGYEISSLHN